MARILVIDDEPTVRDYLRRILEREGFSVLEAGDGEEGLAALDKGNVDLIILDILMPKKDGIEFLIDLRQRTTKVGVIAVSGGGRPSGCYLTPAKALGAAKALAKPFDRADLIDAVRDMLEQVTLN